MSFFLPKIKNRSFFFSFGIALSFHSLFFVMIIFISKPKKTKTKHPLVEKFFYLPTDTKTTRSSVCPNNYVSKNSASEKKQTESSFLTNTNQTIQNKNSSKKNTSNLVDSKKPTIDSVKLQRLIHQAKNDLDNFSIPSNKNPINNNFKTLSPSCVDYSYLASLLKKHLELPSLGFLILELSFSSTGDLLNSRIISSSNSINSNYVLSKLKSLSFKDMVRNKKDNENITLRIKLISEKY